METLTRAEAIKRCKDIAEGIGIDHLRRNKTLETFIACDAAISELMAIFDIKEWELK